MTGIGVTKKGKTYTARIYVPGAKSCRIRLYNQGDEAPVSYVNMSQCIGSHGLFECSFETDGAVEYDFETDAIVTVDPYAKRLVGNEKFGPVPASYRGVLPDKAFKPGNARLKLHQDDSEAIDYSDMVIYKLHVRGFTAHETSGVRSKGTFRGVRQKLSYIRGLGFNTLLLMPCYEFDENMKVGYGREPKVNYWGYGAKGYYFAPKASYASDPARCCEEFSELVRSVHDAGMEIMMEMDFAEGTPDIVMLESLRFWHEVYHVDGFRLISGNIYERIMASDPELVGVKMIASSWNEECTLGLTAKDRPVLAECNEAYMEAVRRFLKGDEGTVKDFSWFIKYNGDRTAKVNYLADHDGFTLADVYSYDVKHNEANGEKNVDGREINHSWNCGTEGPTDSHRIMKLRQKMLRNAIAALFLSQGTPMMMSGDEFGCSHHGNNNPYCCDNEQGWVVWDNSAQARELRQYVKNLIELRLSHRVFSNVIGLRGTDYIYSGCPDVSFHGTKAWYPDYGHFSRMLGVLLNGEYARIDRSTFDDSFYVAFNMHWEPHEFDLPTTGKGEFEMILSTDPTTNYDGGRTCSLPARSIAVFALC